MQHYKNDHVHAYKVFIFHIQLFLPQLRCYYRMAEALILKVSALR
jgi:hypothetical protein